MRNLRDSKHWYGYAVILNGRAFTIQDGGHPDFESIDDVPEEDRQTVLNWIKDNLVKTKTENIKHTSYGMKHILEHDTGIYLTNNQFKDAMLVCGFMPCNQHELNWTYRVSQKSPAFNKKW